MWRVCSRRAGPAAAGASRSARRAPAGILPELDTYPTRYTALVPKDVPNPPGWDKTLIEVMAEAARLKRQSAELLKRIADLDEKIAERPLAPAKPPRPKKPT